MIVILQTIFNFKHHEIQLQKIIVGQYAFQTFIELLFRLENQRIWNKLVQQLEIPRLLFTSILGKFFKYPVSFPQQKTGEFHLEIYQQREILDQMAKVSNFQQKINNSKQKNFADNINHLLINIISKQIMQLLNPLRQKDVENQWLTQRTYVIYTPKIIKFVYSGTSKAPDQCQDISKRIETELSHTKAITLKESKYSVLSKKTLVSQRNGRIQLLSNKRPIIYLKGKNKANKNKTQHSVQQSSNEGNRKPTSNASKRVNPVTEASYIQNYSCDFFTECNESSEINEEKSNPLTFDRSRIALQNKKPKIQTQKYHVQVMKNSQSSELDQKSPNHFHKRKNIFEEQSLNPTFEAGYNKERSRSRKSIFETRTKLCDLSFSKDRSTSKRKKIFESVTLNILPNKTTQLRCQTPLKSRIAVKSYDQQLQQSQIPRAIFQQWERNQPKRAIEVQTNTQILETAKQTRRQ